MSIGLQIIDPSVSSQILKVDSQGQGRGILYDSNGRPIVKNNKASVDGDHGGLLISGADFEVARSLRAGPTGELAVNTSRSPYIWDTPEGTSVDLWTWIQTTTTMTIAQTVAGGTVLNSGNSTAATVGAMHTSHKKISIAKGLTYVLQVVAKPNTHQSGSIHEIGFGSPATAIPSTGANIVDGACFRKDTSGNWKPVIATNSSELEGSVLVDNTNFIAAVPVGEFAVFTIELSYDHARFMIQNMAGTVVASADLDIKQIANSVQFLNSGLQVLLRTMNNSAPSSAVQLAIKSVICDLMEGSNGRHWDSALSSMGKNSLIIPTSSLQSANWSNSAAPTSRTLANTTAGETTLGGQLLAAAMAGGETDLIMFGWQNPSINKSFIVTGIKIAPPVNGVVAVATTATTFIYFWAANASAVSLATAAPYSPMRQAIPGVHTAAVALAVGLPFSGEILTHEIKPGVPIFPSRFLHIGCRCLLGTATATETYRWTVSVQGYYE